MCPAEEQYQFFFFCIPQLYLWGSPFLVRFLHNYMTVFNPTIEVVTFRFRGWCVLGVFVAGNHPSKTWISGSFESELECMCAQTRPRFILSSKRVFWGGMESETMLTPRENFPLPEAQRKFEPWCCITQDSEPNTLPSELFRPCTKSTLHYRKPGKVTSLALNFHPKSEFDCPYCCWTVT